MEGRFCLTLNLRKRRFLLEKYHKILVAPLDWGLGHATRSIPLIRYFLEQGKQVAVATSGQALKLLQLEFSELEFFELPAYNIQYTNESMVLNMLLQLPKVRTVIFKENRAVRQILKQFPADLIISDNRYGIYHNEIPSVFLGHQLAIQVPTKLKAFSGLLLKWHKKMLQPFNQIWVPDFENKPNLSGDLSHSLKFKSPIYFVGPLSRFKYNGTVELDIPLLIIISGQEPKRTHFEKQIIEQLKGWESKVVLIRGLPDTESEISMDSNNIEVYNHLKSSLMQSMIERSQNVICRSGYSSIMDLAALRKKVLFVPTAGQTEQEYLAKYLSDQGFSLSVEEKGLNLYTDIDELKLTSGLHMENNQMEVLLAHAIKKL